MDNCEWCNKNGAFKFSSYNNGKKQYSREKFCSKKCLAEYEENNYTVHWYDAKWEDEYDAKILAANADSGTNILNKDKKSSYLWQIVFISIGLYFFSQGDRKWGFIGVCVGLGYGYNQWLGNRKNK